MRRNIDRTCSGDPCCKPRSIRTINTMNPDDSGNFTIRGDQGIHVTVGTNEILISGIAMYYDNLDGNLVIDNDALTIDLADDIVIAGDLTVNGTYYTVHAEHVYTEDDYIIMRDGAVTGLGSGQYSGFQVKLYDGVNDGRLVMDNSGTARVGDVGDEQPLMTRDESADLTDGDALIWDAANQKAITQSASFAYADDNGRSIVIGANTNYTDATVTAPDAGTYLISIRGNFRVSSPGDDIVAYGLSFSGGATVYLGNIYPNGATGLYRINGSFMFTMTAGQTVYPIVYRTGTGTATSTDSFMRCEIVRVA